MSSLTRDGMSKKSGEGVGEPESPPNTLARSYNIPQRRNFPYSISRGDEDGRNACATLQLYTCAIMHVHVHVERYDSSLLTHAQYFPRSRPYRSAHRFLVPAGRWRHHPPRALTSSGAGPATSSRLLAMIALDGAKGAAQRGRDVRGAAVCVRGTQIGHDSCARQGHSAEEVGFTTSDSVNSVAPSVACTGATQRPHGEAAADGGLVVRFCIDRVEMARDGDLRERVIHSL